MRFWRANNTSTQKKRAHLPGFTLIEMLVIAPIAVIIIAGFIGLMIRMTGEVITSEQRSTQIYESQEALSRLELDINRSSVFTETIPTTSLSAPQGSDDSAAAWDVSPGGDTLILNELATNDSPISPQNTRTLIYTDSPNSCSNYPGYTYNNPYEFYAVYFLRKPSGSDTSTLWRRTILPPNFNLCSTPWQRNSCSPSAPMNGSPCKTSDEKILEHVSDLSFDYYLDPSDSSSTNNITLARTINATITTKTIKAGHPYTYTLHLWATRGNNKR